MKTINPLFMPFFYLFFLGSILSYANPPVELWRGGAVSTYSTIQAAINAAQAGDTIRIRGGKYYENLVLNGSGSPATASGTSTHPIRIEGVPGDTVIIDGADTGLQSTNTRWTNNGGGEYQTTVAFTGNQTWKWISAASVSASDSLMATYWKETKFDAGIRGQGIIKDSATSVVKIRLSNNRDPNNVVVNIGTADGIIKVQNVSYWDFSNLQLKHAGFAGIYLAGTSVSHLTFDKIKVTTSFRGLSTDESASGSYITVSNCQFSNLMPRNWYWDGYNDAFSASEDTKAPQRSAGVMIKAASNVEVKNCQMNGWWDGMKYTGTSNKAHHNLFFNCQDDMVELESSSSSDVRFYNNIGYDLNVGISVINNGGDSVYVFRNRIVCTRNMKALDANGNVLSASYYGYCIKFGSSWSPAVAKNVKFFNNSFYAYRSSFWDAHTITPSHFTFVNNIFCSGHDGNNFVSNDTTTHTFTNSNKWMYNLWYRDVNLHETGIQLADPKYVRAQYTDATVPLNLNIKSTSPAKDNGTSYPQTTWSGLDGTSPSGTMDIGANEYGVNDNDSSLVGPSFSFPTQVGDGLTARYYTSATDFSNPATLTRIDATVNFDWGNGAPATSISNDVFVVRWSGDVKAVYNETYTFYTDSDDGVRLWVNNTLLVDKWVSQSEKTWSGTISLAAGKRYPIVLEYTEYYATAICKLSWSSASTSTQIIPTSQLFSQSNANFRKEDAENIKQDDIYQTELFLYPVPVSDELLIMGANNTGDKIQLFNGMGELVYTQKINVEEENVPIRIDTKNLKSGTYVLVLGNKRKMFSKQ